MINDNERSKVLYELAIGYAHDIGTKLALDITKDGFNDQAEGITLMSLTFTECMKELAVRLSKYDREAATEMLKITSKEVSRCAQLLGKGRENG